jgi:hypothetical protein
VDGADGREGRLDVDIPVSRGSSEYNACKVFLHCLHSFNRNMAQQYSDPYGHTRPEVQHSYSDSNASKFEQYDNNSTEERPYSQAHYPLPKERNSSYVEDVPERSFAREPKVDANPDGVVRRSRFVGMAANGERPASQWTQGEQTCECIGFILWLTWMKSRSPMKVLMFPQRPPDGFENGEKKIEQAGAR